MFPVVIASIYTAMGIGLSWMYYWFGMHVSPSYYILLAVFVPCMLVALGFMWREVFRS